MPDEVLSYGRQVVANLQEVIGDGLRGVYFVGSVALGGYVPGESDIDIVAVSSHAIPDQLKPSLADAIFDTTRSCPARGLEIGAAMQTAAAWEIEARLIYDEFAWFLYEELWDVSATRGPDISIDERRRRIDGVLDPLLDPGVTDADRARLVAGVFMSVLAARVLPLLSQRSG